MSDELIRMDKEYVTRDGRAVRVLCVDAKCRHYPVAALVTDRYGQEISVFYTATGCYMTDSKCKCDTDLIPLRVKHTRTVWVNVYPVEANSGFFADSKKRADDLAGHSPHRIACKEVTFDYYEGEGL
jgi:hypothetical protein